MKYYKKPDSIKAIQYKGLQSLPKIEDFLDGVFGGNLLYNPSNEDLVIPFSSSGNRSVPLGSYVVVTPKMEVVILDEGRFKERYERRGING